MRKKISTGHRAVQATALLTLALASAPTPSQERFDASRIYAGVGLAGLEFEDKHEGAAYDDSTMGWQLYGGYRLSDRIAVELAYKSFGNIEARDVPASGVERLDVSARLDVAVVRALGVVNLSEAFRWRRDFSVFASLGYHSAELKRSVVELSSLDGASATTRDSGLALGGGALYRLGRFDLRGYVEWLDVDEIDRARDVGVAVQFRF